MWHPWVGQIPWRRAWPPTPEFWPGESHGHRSLVGYSPRGRRESETTEQLNHPHQDPPLSVLRPSLSPADFTREACG